jgi:hypothetical protein
MGGANGDLLGAACVVTLVMEKGAHSSFKTMCGHLRRIWRCVRSRLALARLLGADPSAQPGLAFPTGHALHRSRRQNVAAHRLTITIPYPPAHEHSPAPLRLRFPCGYGSRPRPSLLPSVYAFPPSYT